MNRIQTTLLASVAALSLAAAPTFAQQTAPATGATPPATAAPANPDAPLANRSFDETYGERFADWGDQSVEELLGKTVVNDQGETIGDIDNFALIENKLVAVLGVGGFLGMGEHEVGIPLDQLDFAAGTDQLVLPGVTREQLQALPEYDETVGTVFTPDQTLRTGFETVPGMDAPAEAPAMAGNNATVAPAPGVTAPSVAGATAANNAVGAPGATTDINAPAAPAGDTNMAADAGGWTEEMDTVFADIADREIADLIGMSVASAQGEVVGEIDNFVLDGQNVVAIVGVGGFLGIGEHNVALSLGDMTYDGEKLVLSLITEEQLRDMPAYDAAEPNYVPQDRTLRNSYDN